MRFFGSLFRSRVRDRELSGTSFIEKQNVFNSVKSSSWRRRGTTIEKTFEFADQPAQNIRTTLQIECYVTRYLNGNLDYYLRFILSPYLHIMSGQKPFQSHMTSAPFLVCLSASGSGSGTEFDPIIQGGMFKVSACALADEKDAALFDVADTQDVMVGIKSLCTGRNLTFAIYDQDANPPVKLKLQLPNDTEFKVQYGRLQNSV